MMRKLLGTLLPLPVMLAAACAGDDGPTPFDGEDFPLSGEDEIKGDFPGNASLESGHKADTVYPKQWNELATLQSPVKSQGSRGVCSIFATTGQVEHLYIKAGMPVAEADFSEQYMQWSVKNQVGAYRNSEGSNGDSNLDSVVDYGTVKEAAWPYESSPWTAANDAACTGGDNLPTKCYTNGEPPQSAVDGDKFRLPSNRWVNTTVNSLKAHLTTKKTGVVVGMTFFYQSWNHRRSALPVNAEYWRKGYVTYPNAEDKTKSAEQRAGHAIMIIGWDDELEVPMRDKDGAEILDGEGRPRTEKGFWLFKNSWGTAGFGVEHPSGAGYGWLSYKYVTEYGNGAIAEPPSAVRPEPEAACDDGQDNDRDGQTDCDDSDCSGNAACSSNPTAHTYTSTPNLSIPDNDPSGVGDTIVVPDTGTVGSVRVTVAIDHTYRGDLTLSLAHDGVTRAFFTEEGGATDDVRATFDVAGHAGTDLAGDWTLLVVDGAGQDVGTLETWTLEVVAN